MKNVRERRKTPHVEIKLHIGSEITIHHSDDAPIPVHIDEIIPRGRGHYEVSGKDIVDGEYYTFIITR